MSEPEVVHEQKSVFFTVKRAMIVGAIVLGVFGALTGDAKWGFKQKEITRFVSSEVLAGCIVGSSFTGQSGEILGSATRLSVEECAQERSFKPDAPLQNIYKTENVEKKVLEPVRARDFGGEAISRGLRLVMGGALGALGTYLLTFLFRRKKELLSVLSQTTKVIALSISKISKSAKAAREDRTKIYKERKPGASNLSQSRANKNAQIVLTFASFLFFLGFVGSIIIGFSPEEQCKSFGGGLGGYCVKDWTTSIIRAFVAFFLNSLIMLSIIMVASYIQWRTSATEE